MRFCCFQPFYNGLTRLRWIDQQPIQMFQNSRQLRTFGRRLHTTSKNKSVTALTKFMGPKPMPKKGSSEWYREMVLLCTVFAITGSSTMILVRPAVSKGLGLSGSLREGPWTYRICSIVIMTPVYCTMLVAVGTVFGRHSYFRHFAIKMISRFGIPPEMIDSSYHTTHKTFRKW